MTKLVSFLLVAEIPFRHYLQPRPGVTMDWGRCLLTFN
jgi:hypothetical protein